MKVVLSKTLRKVEFGILSIFENYGFDEIKVPMIEFPDNKMASLQVREDFTEEIAKRFAKKTELKVCYRGSIFRISPFGKPEEKYHIGCEIMKSEKISEEDVLLCAEVFAEVICVVKKLFKEDVIVMLGHRGIMKEELGDLSYVFFLKNAGEISHLVEQGKISRKKAKAFFSVFQSKEELKNYLRIPKEVDIFSSVLERYSLKVLYNLSEIAEKDYYTGILFSSFIFGRKFAVGGEYKIGKTSGIGFSVNLFSLSS